MVDDLKKHIDSLVKRKLKMFTGSYEEAGLPSRSINKGLIIDYAKWLVQVVDQTIESCLPKTINQYELFNMLVVKLSYKQNFKQLCDADHPMLFEIFKSLDIREEESKTIVNYVKKINADYLDYFELFKEDLCLNSFSFSNIISRIDQLSIDSAQGTLVSHPAKMSNPSCKFPKILAYSEMRPDGFIRTGNAPVEVDLHINATKLKVFKFLALKVGHLTVLDLIKSNNTHELAELFLTKELVAKIWVENFSKCITSQDHRSNPLVKQIYFPVKDDYHQLSLLASSGLVFLLKERIEFMNNRSCNSYLGKQLKKNNKYSKLTFSTMFDLTETKHGGDHPKNISGLNNKYQSTYLLNSLPPMITKRDHQIPNSDFFKQSIKYYQFKDLFLNLHNIYLNHTNNMHVRAARDQNYQAMFERIVEKMWLIRSIAQSQFNPEYSQLKHEQKIWLLDEYQTKRDSEDAWLESIILSITQFVVNGYEKILAKKAIKFGDVEYKYMTSIIAKNKEFLR